MGHRWDMSGTRVGHEWDTNGTQMGHIRQKWDNVKHKWDKWDMGGIQVGQVRHEWDTNETCQTKVGQC